ncbi:hypothetical protein [Kovacikia minuta]
MEVLLQLLATPTIASKNWVYRQYDHQVQNNTVLLPGGADAAIVRIRPVEVTNGKAEGRRQKAEGRRQKESESTQNLELRTENSAHPSPLTPHLSPPKGVAATVDCNPRYVYLNPFEGAKAAGC